MKVAQFKLTSVRFGIPAGEPEICAGPGDLFCTPSGRWGTLRLRLHSGELLDIPAEVLSGILPGIPSSQLRSRVRAGCIDIIVGGDGRASANATLEVNQSVPLERIAEFAALHSASHDQPVELQLAIDEQRINLGRLSRDRPENDINWEYVYRAARTLQNICHAALRSDIQLTIADVCKAIGTADLAGTCHLSPLLLLTVFASDWHMRLELQPSEEAPASFDCLVGYSLANVGRFCFGTLVKRSIPQDVLIDGKRHINFGSTRLIEAFIGFDGSKVKGAIEAAYKKTLNQMNTEAVLAIGDCQAFIAMANGEHDIRGDRPRIRHPSPDPFVSDGFV